MSKMKIHEIANAKINLYLDVAEKREDGFHNLTTVMHQISLCDELDIEAWDADKTVITLTVEGGNHIPNDSRNLVYVAIMAFLNTIHRPMNVTVKLKKRIPSMAGLGGGSSDAAAALRGMNRLTDFPLSIEKLEQFAADIGSDVPFFIRKISALCLGRGEILQDFTPNLQAFAVLAEGREPSSTKTAFAKLDSRKSPKKTHPNFDTFSFDDVYNAFENVVALDCPSVAEHLNILRKHSPLCAAMTGSGSAVFALFETEEKAICAADDIILYGSVAHVCKLI